MPTATVYEVDPHNGAIIRVYRAEMKDASEFPSNNAVSGKHPEKTGDEGNGQRTDRVLQVVPDGGEGYLRYTRLVNGGQPGNDPHRT